MIELDSMELSPNATHVLWSEVAFGDVCMAAMTVGILNDNGVDAWLASKNASLLHCKKLKGVPNLIMLPDSRFIDHYDITSFESVCLHPFSCESLYSDEHGFIQEFLGRFSATTKKPITITRNTVPVMFKQENVPCYDVALGTKTGPWGPYKRWPYFAELKIMLTDAGMTWVDMDESLVRGNTCLNVVKRCRVYVGLETGRSHYVSSVAGGKTIIIQSGFAKPFHYCTYDYEFIEHPMPCAPCKLIEGCQHGHECMTKISPQRVFDRIVARLGRGQEWVAA